MSIERVSKKSAQIHIPELPATGLFCPYDYYRSNMLFASQGRETVSDESINRLITLDPMRPVSLIDLPGKLIIFDGHHRTSWAILQQSEIPFCVIPIDKIKDSHIYPFYIFFREFKQRIGRFDI